MFTTLGRCCKVPSARLFSLVGWGLHKESSIVCVVGLLSRFARVSLLCLLEARPAVQGIFLLRFLTGASFSGPLLSGAAITSLYVGAALWGCVTLSIYILNGAMDVEEDRINGSTRPIARGDLTTAQAATAAAILAALGLAGALMLGMTWNVAVMLVLGWLYSGPPLYLKRWPAGLASVAILGGLLTYHAGYIVNGAADEHLELGVFSGVMALWMGLVGQTKDLSDVEGDREAGRRSGPVAWGEGLARLLYSVIAFSLGATYLVWSALYAPDLLGSSTMLMLGALGVVAVTLGPWSKGARTKRRRPYKVFMLTQYGAHLLVLNFWEL